MNMKFDVKLFVLGVSLIVLIMTGCGDDDDDSDVADSQIIGSWLAVAGVDEAGQRIDAMGQILGELAGQGAGSEYKWIFTSNGGYRSVLVHTDGTETELWRGTYTSGKNAVTLKLEGTGTATYPISIEARESGNLYLIVIWPNGLELAGQSTIFRQI